jgi:hypothetical protein
MPIETDEYNMVLISSLSWLRAEARVTRKLCLFHAAEHAVCNSLLWRGMKRRHGKTQQQGVLRIMTINPAMGCPELDVVSDYRNFCFFFVSELI